jgi:hypothetical protein
MNSKDVWRKAGTLIGTDADVLIEYLPLASRVPPVRRRSGCLGHTLKVISYSYRQSKSRFDLGQYCLWQQNGKVFHIADLTALLISPRGSVPMTFPAMRRAGGDGGRLRARTAAHAQELP